MDGLRAAKRPRLSMACNECRRRKVKCDADYPKCRNCRTRNDVCVTTDPKRPDAPVNREWAELPDPPRAPSAASLASLKIRSPSTSLLHQSQGALVAEATVSPQSQGAVEGTAALNDETIGISPVQQPYDMSFNIDYTTDRIKMLGGSSSQCLTKSLDVYLKAAHVQPLSNGFLHGMRYVEEMEIPLSISTPPMPEPSQRNLYLSAFFDKIHPLYPMLDIDEFKNHVHQLSAVSDLKSLSYEQIPILASAYLVLSLGADEQAQQFTDDGVKYLHAAASLLGHVILIPYLPAVQTLLLFTLSYRGRNKDGIGWQTLGMAIRIAHTLGLHRHSTKHPSNQHAIQNRGKQLFHARIWAICCSLEKMMQLESGRPSIIETVDNDQMMAGRDQSAPSGHNFVQWHMELAQYQGLISQHIYGHQLGDRSAQQILLDTARIDRALLSWAHEMPPEFRPGDDLFCSNHEFHIAAFLSIQYYQAMISLHRAALIAPAATFQSEVDNHCPDDPSRLRLRGGEVICVNSARSIAKLVIMLSDRNIESRIFTAGPPLQACIVLGLSLMKNSGSRMQAADLELLRACVDYSANQFLKCGHNANFAKAIISIHDNIRSYVDQKLYEQFNDANSRPTKMRAIANPRVNHQQFNGLDWPNFQASGQNSTPSLYGDVVVNNGTHDSSTYDAMALPASKTAYHTSDYQSSLSSSTEKAGELIMAPPAVGVALNGSRDLYFDSLPFDNFNVEELWNWMLITDPDDNLGNRAYDIPESM